MQLVAALYVDVERGPYNTMTFVDAWGEARDATTYAGPWPVVAHPPCGHWGRYSHKCHDTGETGPIAVAQVREHGGVLEHPRNSSLWKHCGMPAPDQFADEFGGYTIAVQQCDWGHVATKHTWLYIVGVAPQDLPTMPPPQPPREAPYRKANGRLSSPLERMKKSARHLTPPAFAAWLVELARCCRVSPTSADD